MVKRRTLLRSLGALGVLGAVALAAALVTAPAPVAAQGAPADAVLRDFELIGDYVLEIEGREVAGAEILQSERAVAILVLAPGLPSAVLLTPRSAEVATLDLAGVARQADGSMDVLADAEPVPAGKFEVAGESVAFKIDGRQAMLKPKPPLLESHSGGDLKAYDPGYARAARAYQPDDAALASLRSQSQPVKVRVFFGSWCSYCKRYLPRLLRVEDELRGSRVQFEYIGLTRALDDPEAQRLRVNSVPTGIVYVGGREVGRLQGNAWQAPESGLRELLQKGGAPASGVGG
jgi:thiol-disulfide isomerase/thioredoxin